MTDTRPLAVHSSLATCSNDHVGRLVTNGVTAYGYTLGTSSAELGGVSRHQTLLSAVCPHPTGGTHSDGVPDVCGQPLEWRIDAVGTWVSEKTAIDMLVSWGTKVDQ